VAELKKIITEQLFSSPLSGFEVPDAAELNRGLISASNERRSAEAGMRVTNQYGWHSDRDLFSRPEPAYRTLCSHITGALIYTAQTTLNGFSLETHDIQGQGWVNINGKGGFNTPHDHGSFHWSGCYYASIPETAEERSGNIEFLDPRGCVGFNPAEVSLIFAPKFQVAPKAGQMLIFPSYLRHWVYPNQEDADRISIAFNARIVRRVLAASDVVSPISADPVGRP